MGKIQDNIFLAFIHENFSATVIQNSHILPNCQSFFTIACWTSYTRFLLVVSFVEKCEN